MQAKVDKIEIVFKQGLRTIGPETWFLCISPIEIASCAYRCH
jgi:hypothetical protein